MDDARKEAFIWTRYLIGEDVGEREIDLYRKALKELSNPLTSFESHLESLIFRLPFLLPAIDGALAWIRPDAELRHRIFLMLAILETSPERAHYFLDQNRKFFSFCILFFKLCAVTLFTILGFFVVLPLRFLCR